MDQLSIAQDAGLGYVSVDSKPYSDRVLSSHANSPVKVSLQSHYREHQSTTNEKHGTTTIAPYMSSPRLQSPRNNRILIIAICAGFAVAAIAVVGFVQFSEDLSQVEVLDSSAESYADLARMVETMFSVPERSFVMKQKDPSGEDNPTYQIMLFRIERDNAIGGDIPKAVAVVEFAKHPSVTAAKRAAKKQMAEMQDANSKGKQASFVVSRVLVNVRSLDPELITRIRDSFVSPPSK